MKRALSIAASLLISVQFITACDARKPYLKGGQNVVQNVDTQHNLYVLHNIYYVEHGNIRQTMDLYLPAFAKKPYPLIIWLHGGSWSIGDKNLDCIPCRSFGDKFAIASVNYRFSQDAPFPSQINDVKAAVRYLRANAKTHGIDPNRIGVWGSSAGGYLAALLGTTGDIKALEGSAGIAKVSSRVQAVADWSGPTDFVTAEKQAPATNKIRFRGVGSPVYDLMGMRMDNASLANASPVTYVTKDDPPFLIMHGTADDAIPLAQSEELYKRLLSSGVKVQYRVLKGQGHSLDLPDNIAAVRQFFEETLASPANQK